MISPIIVPVATQNEYNMQATTTKKASKWVHKTAKCASQEGPCRQTAPISASRRPFRGCYEQEGLEAILVHPEGVKASSAKSAETAPTGAPKTDIFG